MIALRGPKGLGDAIYLRAIALHLVVSGESVRIYTKWPEVFSDIPVEIQPISKDDPASTNAFYCLFCLMPEARKLDQFSMMCVQAGVSRVPLRLGWAVKNQRLLGDIKKRAGGRKILVYQPPKKANNDEQELLRPRREAFNLGLEELDYFRVRIGNPEYLQKFESPYDMDLLGKTTIPDAFDIGTIADLFYGDSCFLVPLAESLDKKMVMILTRRGINSDRLRVNTVRKERIVHKPELVDVIYDES